jgi:hypothetical protein
LTIEPELFGLFSEVRRRQSQICKERLISYAYLATTYFSRYPFAR